MKSFSIGGQERVTSTLANYFSSHGHKVTICSFAPAENGAESMLEKNVSFLCLNAPFQYSRQTAMLVRDILETQLIDVVINQWGLPYMPAKILYVAKKGLSTRTIAVYHHDPATNARIMSVELAVEHTRSTIKKIYLRLKEKLFKEITSRSMKYVYDHSDRYVLLSNSYIQAFSEFARIKNINKVNVIPNPLTVINGDFCYNVEKKSKNILYVGRLERYQKRVERVIDVWSHIVSLFPDWSLSIVGDGPDKKRLEEYVESLNLHNVYFYGFQNPIDYLKRASILMLTSEYEGFGLVIIEAMSYGTVPVVYGSYSAVYDIIDDGKNGIIIPKTLLGFNASMMAEKMQELMTDKTGLNILALSAIEKSKQFSLDKIYQEWMKVMQ